MVLDKKEFDEYAKTGKVKVYDNYDRAFYSYVDEKDMPDSFVIRTDFLRLPEGDKHENYTVKHRIKELCAKVTYINEDNVFRIQVWRYGDEKVLASVLGNPYIHCALERLFFLSSQDGFSQAMFDEVVSYCFHFMVDSGLAAGNDKHKKTAKWMIY